MEGVCRVGLLREPAGVRLHGAVAVGLRQPVQEQCRESNSRSTRLAAARAPSRLRAVLLPPLGPRALVREGGLEGREAGLDLAPRGARAAAGGRDEVAQSGRVSSRVRGCRVTAISRRRRMPFEGRRDRQVVGARDGPLPAPPQPTQPAGLGGLLARSGSCQKQKGRRARSRPASTPVRQDVRAVRRTTNGHLCWPTSEGSLHDPLIVGSRQRGRRVGVRSVSSPPRSPCIASRAE